MAEPRKRIKSQKLLGITKLDDDHRERAEMHSTGAMEVMFKDETNPKSWAIEYRCDVCKETVQMWTADTNDLIREVLKDEGIIKS